MGAEPVFLWRFENAEFDQARWELRIGGTPVELEPRPLAVLFHLLRHSGQAVTKDELMQAVYGHTHVGDGALSNAVGKLRRVLDDEDQQIIATVHRVGYRFSATVNRVELEGARRDVPFSLRAGASLPKRNKWKLIRPLGPSDDLEVWLAQHEKTREQRVFKVSPKGVRLSALKRETTIFRVLKEALGDRRDLVKILDWNFEEAPFYIESEYGGLNLVEWAESLGGLDQVPLEARVELLAETAEAVAAAHGASVLHKDLKPANVLIYPDDAGAWHPRLTDFGSARLLEEHTLKALGITQLGFTQTQAVSSDPRSGTPLYLAPEVIAGEPQTQASDVYALGVMLYQLGNADLRKPLAPGWEDDIEDDLLREDIAHAANGNPAKRIASAAELAQRLRARPQRRRDLEQSHADEAKTQSQWVARERFRVKRLWPVPAACIAAALLSLVIWIYHMHRPRQVDATADPLSPKTLAVVPSLNESIDPAIDYLSDGISEEVIDGLIRIPGLRIISRSSSFKFKGKSDDVKDVGLALGVRYLLQVRLKKNGTRIHMSAELTDTADATEIWAQTYDRDESDLPEIQAEIVLAAAHALNVGIPDNHPAIYGQNANVAAHEAYLQGLYYYGRFTADALRRSIDHYQDAIRIDPGYAAAYAEQSVSWSALADQLGGAEAAEAYAKSRTVAEAALKLNPDLAQGHTSLGWVLMNADWNLDAAEVEFRRARQLAPAENRPANNLAVVLASRGQLEEAIDLLREAAALNPLAAAIDFNLAAYLIPAGRLDEAEAAIRKVIDLQPTGSGNYAYLSIIQMQRRENTLAIESALKEPDEIWRGYALALAYHANGDGPKADDALGELLAKHSDDAPAQISDVYAWRGEIDKAFEWLDRAYTAHDPGVLGLMYDPFLLPYKTDPRFVAIKGKLGLSGGGSLAAR